MALKDWKKSKKFGDYKNNKTGSIVKIQSLNRGTHRIWANHQVISKEFKTKSRALAFAKSYMRKH